MPSAPSAEAAKKLPISEPDAGRADEEAEPDVPGAEVVLREHDLGDVDARRRDARGAPHDEHRDEVARA